MTLLSVVFVSKLLVLRSVCLPHRWLNHPPVLESRLRCVWTALITGLLILLTTLVNFKIVKFLCSNVLNLALWFNNHLNTVFVPLRFFWLAPKLWLNWRFEKLACACLLIFHFLSFEYQSLHGFLFNLSESNSLILSVQIMLLRLYNLAFLFSVWVLCGGCPHNDLLCYRWLRTNDALDVAQLSICV